MEFITATALAHPNIAFIKYWGNLDESLHLPANGSISMCLDGLVTRTTVALDPSLEQDRLTLDGQSCREMRSRGCQHSWIMCAGWQEITPMRKSPVRTTSRQGLADVIYGSFCSPGGYYISGHCLLSGNQRHEVPIRSRYSADWPK